MTNYHKRNSKSESLKTNRNKKNDKLHVPVNSVRIIGGQYKRRNINFINTDGLRPTPDRVREMLFNWLMHDIYNANVLDAFAGSGVLGFEALSRGAEQVTLIESNKQQALQLNQTATQLKVNDHHIEIHHGKADEVIPILPKKTFDLVFLDPPYAHDLWLSTIQSLIVENLINENTLLYIEADKEIEQLFQKEPRNEWTLKYEVNMLKNKKIGQVYSNLIKIAK